MHKREKKNHSRIIKFPSEESHLLNDTLGENKRNPAKKQVKSLSLPNLNTTIRKIIWRGGGQGVWRGGRQGDGRGGPATEWAIDEVCSRMEGGFIQAYVG